ncbi:DUF3558 domain-containing protein [Streptomyces longwoodensis]|uniref:DUF3558 domain-containing protein n=1 Tax=Streptomyces longwoodensis TaxID=68231 RepID=UPI002DD7AD6F|nr:DUF3558 domain-containing protein [Streptomyces longwoodensis]WRY89979.1 DUF3558 domain-containing protein [Streptomyces longwoodensis]WTI45709.1 DUF3558 domain-containing protein [Streptomyces longwoodensis]
MQRKAYVTGVAALLAALLAGCTGGSDDGGSDDNSKSGQAGTVTAPAQPGKYATLPEPCGAVPRGTLDALLPGVRQLPDQQQREAAYDGSPALTFDTDRKVGCRWKVESSDATDHLSVDFERVVSYANAVSDDAQAEQLFAEERDAADLPEPAPSGTGGGTPSASVSTSPAGAASAPASGTPSPSASASASSSSASADLQPRTLDDLGDEAFLNDVLSSSGSTAKQRTITVAFRTSNVIVTLQYEEQPATVGAVPDSKEMQDKARKLASQLADALAG